MDGIKTQIHQNAQVTRDNEEYRNKKFGQDIMQPEDEKKLDSMKWKMTNKVAKDYISLLLGYSRKKTYTDKGDGPEPLEPLKPDKGFGDSMAKKALSGRGLLGRLKQKLFAGG